MHPRSCVRGIGHRVVHTALPCHVCIIWRREWAQRRFITRNHAVTRQSRAIPPMGEPVSASLSFKIACYASDLIYQGASAPGKPIVASFECCCSTQVNADTHFWPRVVECLKSSIDSLTRIHPRQNSIRSCFCLDSEGVWDFNFYVGRGAIKGTGFKWDKSNYQNFKRITHVSYFPVYVNSSVTPVPCHWLFK